MRLLATTKNPHSPLPHKNYIYMYRKVSLSSLHNGKVGIEYCATSGSGDIDENASALTFYSDFRW